MTMIDIRGTGSTDNFQHCPSWCEVPERLRWFSSSDGGGRAVRQHSTGTVVSATDPSSRVQASTCVCTDELYDEETRVESWGPRRAS